MIWWPTEIPTLQYGLISLRAPDVRDIQSIFEAAQDPLISQFTTLPANYTLDHAVDFVQRTAVSVESRRELPFIVEYGNGADREFAGVFSLHSINIKNHCAEIGYWIHKPMRAKGVGTIAAKIITDWGIRTLGFKRIEGLADADNLASQKLMVSAGYEREGLLKNKVTRDNGEQIDMVLLAAIEERWIGLDA